MIFDKHTYAKAISENTKPNKTHHKQMHKPKKYINQWTEFQMTFFVAMTMIMLISIRCNVFTEYFIVELSIRKIDDANTSIPIKL